jgi:hypothetical protein
MLTTPEECYSPIRNTDTLCWSVAYPRRLEQQAHLNSKPEPALRSSALKESFHNGITEDREKEGMAPATVCKYEFAELPESQDTSAFHLDKARRSSIEIEHLRNSSDPASSDIRTFYAPEIRDDNPMNQYRKLLRPVASAQSLSRPESLAAMHEHASVASTLSTLHRSASAFFESTTREDSQTTSSNIGNALQCQRLSEQRTLVDFSNTSEDGVTPNNNHDFPLRKVQDAKDTVASNGITDKPLLPPRHQLYQVQSTPASRSRWIEIKPVDYEGNDYGDNTSIYPSSVPAPVPTTSVSLESLAKRDAALMPNFVKDCIWMLDTHGLHLPETYGNDEIAEEANLLRLLLAGDIPLELGEHPCCSCVAVTHTCAQDW